jgi:hypothetical protein
MPFLLDEASIEPWLSATAIDIQNINLLPENEIGAHLIDKRIINSKQPNRKEVQAFYQEDFIQGSLF